MSFSLNEFLTAPVGWNPPIYLNGVVNDGGFIYLPDSPIPPTYTPSNAFWYKSLIAHCSIYFNTALDPFEAFLIGGGMTGTIIGSLSGLQVALNALQIDEGVVTFGYFRDRPGLTLGYSIDDVFKQEIYHGMEVTNIPLIGAKLTHSQIDLIENYRVKRFLIKEGKIASIEKKGTSVRVSLENMPSLPPQAPSALSGQHFSVYRDDGTHIVATVNSVASDWSMEVVMADSSNVRAGNFYSFDVPSYVEDPYLLGGKWQGTYDQSEILISDASKKVLHVTSQNKPYVEGDFLGTYIWKKNPVNTTSTTNATSTTTTTTILGTISHPVAGSTMEDIGQDGWSFYSFQNTSGNTTEIYRNNTRYKRGRRTTIQTGDAAVTETASIDNFGPYEARPSASAQDYSADLQNSSNYIRVEIGHGGYRTRQNYMAPILVGQFIKNNNDYFEIVGQPEAMIIDVKKTGVKKTSFDPKKTTQYSILNHFAWFISEHYPNVFGTPFGVFGGSVSKTSNASKTSNTDFTIEANASFVEADPRASTIDIGLNFYQRFTQELTLPKEIIKAYRKFQNWRMILECGSKEDMVFIESIVFPAQQVTAGTYDVFVKTKTPVLDSCQRAYISFDAPYSTHASATPYGTPQVVVEVATAADRNIPLLLIGNRLCLEGFFWSAPYDVKIGANSRVGFCDGLYFGADYNETALSSYAQMSYITVPRIASGVSSLFHSIKYEEWVLHASHDDSRLVLRKGALDFTEYPSSETIFVGTDGLVEKSSVNPLLLNSSKNYVRRIQLKIDDFSSGELNNLSKGIISNTITFAVGTEDNIFGSFVSGEGKVNLKAIEAPLTADVVPFRDTEGLFVSPVYLYKKKDGIQHVNYLTADMGIPTSEQRIYVKNSSEKDFKIEYVDQNQLIIAEGFFDILRLSDGYAIILYDDKSHAFTLDGKEYDSANDTWPINRSVMAIGSNDDTRFWGMAQQYGIDETNTGVNSGKYPLMLMQGVEYLGAVHVPIKQSLVVFARCYDSVVGKFYIGAFIVPVKAFLDRNLSMCTSSEHYPFVFRLPSVDSTYTKENQLWFPPNEAIKVPRSGYLYTKPKDNESGDEVMQAIPDIFIRVMGSAATGAKVNYAGDGLFSSISPYLLEDGTIMVLYTTADGTKAIYSMDGGINWILGKSLIVRGAESSILIDDKILYISSSGIVIKHTNFVYFYQDRDISHAGVSNATEENNIQQAFDQCETFILASGQVEPQKMSGYLTSSGVYKVYFYDKNAILKCMSSLDGYIWKVADNF